MRYIKNLTQEEQQGLREGHLHGETYRFRNRCQAILLSHSGYSIVELSKMYSVRRNTISCWLNQWEANGLEGLKDRARSGRPSKLSTSNELHVQEVKSLLKTDFQNLNKVRGQLEENMDIEVSKRTLQRFLKVLVFDGDVVDYRSKKDKTK